MKKRLLAVMLTVALCFGMGMTSYAAPQITPEYSGSVVKT